MMLTGAFPMAYPVRKYWSGLFGGGQMIGGIFGIVFAKIFAVPSLCKIKWSLSARTFATEYALFYDEKHKGYTRELCFYCKIIIYPLRFEIGCPFGTLPEFR